MLLDGALALADDHEDVGDARLDGLLDDVLDHRRVDDRQHLLGLRLGGRQEARAESGGGNDGFADHALAFPVPGTILRFDDLDIQPVERLPQFREHALVRVGADDGAAGAGELGAGAGGTGGLDHPDVVVADSIDLLRLSKPALSRPPILSSWPSSRQRLALSVRSAQNRMALTTLGLALLEALADVVVEDLRRLAQVVAVGDVELGQQLGVQRLVVAVALLLHDLLGEVHVDQALVDLDDAVLKPGGNVQFLRLGGQDQVGLNVLGDADAVEGHQGPQARRDDGAGAGQADAVRDVRVVADREVLVVQLDLVFLAVVVEPLDRGLQQADAAVVAVQPHVLDQAWMLSKQERSFSLGRISSSGVSYRITSARKLLKAKEIVLPKYPSEGLPTKPGSRISLRPNNHVTPSVTVSTRIIYAVPTV